jgi:hypothetical protein
MYFGLNLAQHNVYEPIDSLNNLSTSYGNYIKWRMDNIDYESDTRALLNREQHFRLKMSRI